MFLIIIDFIIIHVMCLWVNSFSIISCVFCWHSRFLCSNDQSIFSHVLCCHQRILYFLSDIIINFNHLFVNRDESIINNLILCHIFNDSSQESSNTFQKWEMRALFHNSIFLLKVLNYIKQRFLSVVFLLDALMKHEDREQNVLSHLSSWNDHIQTITLTQEISMIYDC